ncbi:MAG: hypothetical protein Q7S08_02910 [bacterium]|nr:hypothetical protein [bacterium]
MVLNEFATGNGERIKVSIRNYYEKEIVNDKLLSRAIAIIESRNDISRKEKELLSGVFYHVMRGTDITDIAKEFFGNRKSEKQKAAEGDVFRLFNKAEQMIREGSGIQITPEYLDLIEDVRKKLGPNRGDMNNNQLPRPLLKQDYGKKIN